MGLNTFTAQACKISGVNSAHRHAPEDIFDGPITNLLSVLLCALLKKSFQVLMQKERKSPNNFKFGIFIVGLLNGGMASMAVIGRNVLRCRADILGTT